MVKVDAEENDNQIDGNVRHFDLGVLYTVPSKVEHQGPAADDAFQHTNGFWS